MTQARVAGVDLAVANPRVVRASVERLAPGAEHAPMLSAEVRALALLIEAEIPEEETADCEQCGGIGPTDWGHCCFCGVGDDSLQTEAAKVAELARRHSFSAGDTDPLDDNVREILGAKARAATCYWDLGNLIRDNYSRKLWRLRTRADGEAAYTSFLQFCKEELGISHAHAYKLMSVAVAFSKEEVAKFGVTKLGVVLQVPPAIRGRLLEATQDGASKEQLREMARGHNAETGRRTIQNRPRGRKPGKVELPAAGLLGEFTLRLKDDETVETVGRLRIGYRLVLLDQGCASLVVTRALA